MIHDGSVSVIKMCVVTFHLYKCEYLLYHRSKE